jgi:hypothetical protein
MVMLVTMLRASGMRECQASCYMSMYLDDLLILYSSLSSTAKPGTKIQFSGIDLLTIDLASRKVSNAETSSDRVNYYAAIGIDPFAK